MLKKEYKEVMCKYENINDEDEVLSEDNTFEEEDYSAYYDKNSERDLDEQLLNDATFDF
jgi:hypothetical protein